MFEIKHVEGQCRVLWQLEKLTNALWAIIRHGRAKAGVGGGISLNPCFISHTRKLLVILSIQVQLIM